MIIKRGDTGPTVRRIQERLNKYEARITVDGIFGPQTEDAVRFFQSIAGLVKDGIVGPITMRELMPPMSTLVLRVIETAEKYLGLHERGVNRGPEIDAWLRACGVSPGNPWCMAFVQGVVAEAAQELGMPDPLKPDTAGVLDLWNRTPASRRVANTAGQPGDIMIMDMGGGKGHTGIVTSYNNGSYFTIEGNTNTAGSREGDGVYRKPRKASSIKGFVRYDGLA